MYSTHIGEVACENLGYIIIFQISNIPRPNFHVLPCPADIGVRTVSLVKTGASF